MNIPQPPVQADINKAGIFNMPWVAFFTGLVNYIKGLPPSGTMLQEFANDAAAAAGGVKLYGYYKTGSLVKQRVI
jgi:hypothetical protein